VGTSVPAPPSVGHTPAVHLLYNLPYTGCTPAVHWLGPVRYQWYFVKNWSIRVVLAIPARTVGKPCPYPTNTDRQTCRTLCCTSVRYGPFGHNWSIRTILYQTVGYSS